jgi:hypothetical protein
MKLNTIIGFFILAGLMIAPVHAKQDKHQQLPPGLQKKAERGQSLPPGWQKKLARGQVMDEQVYRQSQIVVPVDSHGLLTVRIEGKLVRLYQATREIADVLN